MLNDNTTKSCACLADGNVMTETEDACVHPDTPCGVYSSMNSCVYKSMCEEHALQSLRHCEITSLDTVLYMYNTGAYSMMNSTGSADDEESSRLYTLNSDIRLEPHRPSKLSKGDATGPWIICNLCQQSFFCCSQRQRCIYYGHLPGISRHSNRLTTSCTQPSTRVLSPTQPSTPVLSPTQPATPVLSPTQPTTRVFSPPQPSIRVPSPPQPSTRVLSPPTSSPNKQTSSLKSRSSTDDYTESCEDQGLSDSTKANSDVPDCLNDNEALKDDKAAKIKSNSVRRASRTIPLKTKKRPKSIQTLNIVMQTQLCQTFRTSPNASLRTLIARASNRKDKGLSRDCSSRDTPDENSPKPRIYSDGSTDLNVHSSSNIADSVPTNKSPSRNNTDKNKYENEAFFMNKPNGREAYKSVRRAETHERKTPQKAWQISRPRDAFPFPTKVKLTHLHYQSPHIQYKDEAATYRFQYQTDWRRYMQQYRDVYTDKNIRDRQLTMYPDRLNVIRAWETIRRATVDGTHMRHAANITACQPFMRVTDAMMDSNSRSRTDVPANKPTEKSSSEPNTPTGRSNTNKEEIPILIPLKSHSFQYPSQNGPCSGLELSAEGSALTKSNSQRHTESGAIRPHVGSSYSSTFTPSSLVRRSRPSIPSNARGVICPSDRLTPTLVISVHQSGYGNPESSSESLQTASPDDDSPGYVTQLLKPHFRPMTS